MVAPLARVQSSKRRTSTRLATSTSTRYATVAEIRNAKYEAGSAVKLSSAANGVAGNMVPMATMASVVIVSHRLGRLRKGITHRPNDEEHECLCRQRLHEPSRVKQRFARAEVPQQHEKSEEIEDRADRTEEHHKVPYNPHVPPLRSPEVAVIDVVAGDGHLGQVVEEVIQQDLRRQHGQKGQEHRRRCELGKGSRADGLLGLIDRIWRRWRCRCRRCGGSL